MDYIVTIEGEGEGRFNFILEFQTPNLERGFLVSKGFPRGDKIVEKIKCNEKN